MLFTPSPSISRAKSALILGHTTSGMGERSLSYKMQALLSTAEIVDVIELLGDRYESLAQLNYTLADQGHSLLHDLAPLRLPEVDLILILSWSFSLAALFATNLPRHSVVAKLYAHHTNERILPELYAPAKLLLTESLLANERGAAYGIHPGKMLYFPHSYLELPQPVVKKKRRQRVIGTVCRFEYGKNVEFAIEAVRRLAAQGDDVLLHLKGDFPAESSQPAYRPLLLEMLEAYKDEPWLHWDRTETPFPAVLEEYAQFDLLLHPSGAEGGSHVVVEALGLGIPCVVLNCSTNPYLFKGLATFVETTGSIRPAQLPHFIPEMDHLVATLEKPLPPPDPATVRARFHPDVARARIPLLFEPDAEAIQTLYEEDCALYGI